jgi:hypothetical protein
LTLKDYDAELDEESTPLVYDSPSQAKLEGGNIPPTFMSQVKACLREPIFVCVCLGYAAWTASIAGLSFYIPLFIQTNEPCDPKWDFPEAKAGLPCFADVSRISLVWSEV